MPPQTATHRQRGGQHVVDGQRAKGQRDHVARIVAPAVGHRPPGAAPQRRGRKVGLHAGRRAQHAVQQRAPPLLPRVHSLGCRPGRPAGGGRHGHQQRRAREQGVVRCRGEAGTRLCERSGARGSSWGCSRRRQAGWAIAWRLLYSLVLAASSSACHLDGLALPLHFSTTCALNVQLSPGPAVTPMPFVRATEIDGQISTPVIGTPFNSACCAATQGALLEAFCNPELERPGLCPACTKEPTWTPWPPLACLAWPCTWRPGSSRSAGAVIRGVGLE